MVMSQVPPTPPKLPLPRPLQQLIGDALDRWRRDHGPVEDPAVRLLADAIADGGCHAVYQPIVELPSARPVAVEALVRLEDMEHPELSNAAHIIEVAERSRLIVPLGVAMLAGACTQLATWRRQATLGQLGVHVNVSPLQLRDESFIHAVERVLDVTGLVPEAVTLEVTETAAFDPDGLAEATLSTLALLGVRIAIDDFGTGFASLDLLASTPARSIKLDRSFVASLGEVSETPRGRALVVQAAIGLGRTLGLRVVGEGVETPAQARTLAAWGCGYGQGYLFAKPARAHELQLTCEQAAPWRDPNPPDHGLTPEATDLALAIALVLGTSSPEAGTLRADAQELALVLAEAVGLERRAADITAVLASIADAPQRLAELVSSRSPVASEVITALNARPRIARDASPGALAGAARQLALTHRDGHDPVGALAHLRAADDPALATRVRAWADRQEPSPPPVSQLRALDRRLRSRDDASRRLRSLSALTQAISSTGSLEDLLDVMASEALSTLGASSLTIARLEREHQRMRVLVNVGDIGPDLERRPAEATFPLSTYPDSTSHLLDRSVNIALADAEPTTPETRWLLSNDKGSAIAAPIIVDGASWGQMIATTPSDAPPFTSADTPFATAIANVVSLAVQRTRSSAPAGPDLEDPLTGLANRRALEAHLQARLTDATATTPTGLLLLDVEGLQQINQRYGQATGDQTLVRVANVLARATLSLPRSFVCRLSGDVFAVTLDARAAEVEDLVDRVRARLEDGPAPQPRLAAGYAIGRANQMTIGELLRRADTAQLLAKRTGAPFVAVGPDSDLPSRVLTDTGNVQAGDVQAGDVQAGDAPADDPRARVAPADDPRADDARADHPSPVGDQLRDDGRAAGGDAPPSEDTAQLAPTITHAALRRWASAIEEARPEAQLAAIGDAAASLFELSCYVISRLPAGAGTLHTHEVHARRRHATPAGFLVTDDRYDLDDFPATRDAFEHGYGFTADVDDPAADEHERQLLVELGQRYVLGITEVDAATADGWLLELYGDDLSHPLPMVTPLVEALASRALGRDVRFPPRGTT